MKAIPVVTTHITGFHFKTLAPSNMNIGSRLKKARKLLIVNPSPQIKDNMGENERNWIKIKNIIASAMLVIGPAIEIFPFSSRDIYSPWMYTAPGAAKTNPKVAVTIARINPSTHSRYSA